MKAPATAKRLRCAIYTRKSSEEGLEQDFNSLDAQREACSAYILSQAGEGWQRIPETFDDGGFSGGTMERPALKRLLDLVEAGKVDIIVVYKVDRLTRSLADFARIIEVLDKSNAYFVSVTQAFSTTTSMGRLTLNVLLSFAQFEREVTGERIRDKIAASKRKGLWMGGTLPLGYDPDGRTLKINEPEAATVRHIFARYLELKSVHALSDELERDGVVSKRWVTPAGRQHGGSPISRGALFFMLHNPVYVGEIRHGKERYPGQHPPIIDRETFQAAENLLREGATRKGRGNKNGMPLAGLIFDSKGYRMTPTVARPRGKAVRRYYVSLPAVIGKKEEAGIVYRVHAPELEDLVADRLRRFGILPDGEVLARWEGLHKTLNRIDIDEKGVSLTLSSGADPDPAGIASIETIGATVARPEEGWRVFIPATFRRHGLGKRIFTPGGAEVVEASGPDSPLLKALGRAESWKRQLLVNTAPTIEAIAEAEGVTLAYARRILRLAFLAPDIKWAILDGRTIAGMTVEFWRLNVPDAWIDQRAVVRQI